MKNLNPPELEERRVLALKRYGLLDTAPEKVFDGITLAIANICEVPIALFTLIDSDRQWFKSAFGVKVSETAREIAFCSHAIARPDEMMIVEDATEDPRFKTNPLVTSEPSIRFYAGKPIVTRDGYALGTLCAIDRKPRTLAHHQHEALAALSATISAIVDERLRLQKVVIDQDEIDAVLNQRLNQYEYRYEDSQSILRGLLEAYPTASVVLNPKATIVSHNDAWSEFASGVGWAATEVGADYLHEKKNLMQMTSAEKSAFRAGMQRLIDGAVDKLEHTFLSNNGAWSISAQPLSRPVDGVLVQHFLSTAS
ncbi:MAG: GAF domain-containing protein [Pseudomonadota bacterium]